jgi:hypothetical protein
VLFKCLQARKLLTGFTGHQAMPQTDAGAVNGQAFVMETENPDLFYSASARRKRF